VQQFFKNAAEVKGEQPLSLPAGSEIPCATLRRTEKRVRKATAFRGRANKTALPYKSLRQAILENVPVEHFQRIKAIPHKERLTALLHVCLHIFRHINQKLLDLRQ
jgi:hypothetical protein